MSLVLTKPYKTGEAVQIFGLRVEALFVTDWVMISFFSTQQFEWQTLEIEKLTPLVK